MKVNAKKILSVLILLTLVLSVTVSLSTAIVKAQKPIVAVFAKGLLDPDADPLLKAMRGNITEVEWKVFTDTITFDGIKDAKMLIWVLVDTGLNVTDEELKVIKDWFNLGGRTLWVCGDSDYKGGDFKRIPPANAILETVGSVLRNEHCEAVDRESNIGGRPYRVAAIIDPDPEVDFLKDGVEKPVLFHGPGAVVAYKDGKWIKLEKEKVPNVYRIAWTTEKGAIAEFVKPLPQTHDIGEEGKFVLMAAEVFPKKDNLVILSAEAPFDHYQGMWTPEYKGIALDGPRFIKNVILWGVGLLGERIPKPKPLVAVFAKGLLSPTGDALLNAMMGNITSVKWKVFTDTITFKDIKDAKMLIMVLVDTGLTYTEDELKAIKEWFDQGGRTLWVCGDSDYKGGDFKRIPPANSVLETVGSVLRNEHCEGVDRESNIGGRPYRVAAIIQPDTEAWFLAMGIKRPVLFHGPGVVVAYKDGKWIKLEKERPPNVIRIAWTTEKGAIAEFVKPLPEVHDIGEEGKFVLMAAEIMPEKKNIVILSAEAPFDHYQGMWTPEYKGIPLNGPEFVQNIILWGVGLLGERIPTAIILKQEIAKLQAKEETLKKELEKLTHDLKAKEEEVKSLSEKLTKAEEEIKNVKAELEKTKGELAKRTSELEAKAAEVEKLRSELDKAKSELSKKAAELEAAKAELEKTKAELESVKSELSSVKSELSQAKSRLGDYEKKVKSLEEEVASLSSQVPWYLTLGVIIGIIVGVPVGIFMKKK